MSESRREKEVLFIRGRSESRAIVDHPHRIPWSVVETSVEGDRRRAVTWQVVLFAPQQVAPHPVVFESRDAAKAWTREQDWEEEPDLRCLNEPLKVDEIKVDTSACTDRYRRFAKKHREPLNSFKLLKRAHDENLFHSLSCFPEENCTGDPHVVTSGETVRLPWTAYSCQSVGWSDLWDADGEQVCALRRDSDCDPIPMGAVFARTN